MSKLFEITAATLFSGIGAPETAMPHWRWPWHAEIEKFPSAVLASRHPESVNIGDVTAHEFTERAADIAKPTVLVFGSPCQSFSVAGKRLGMDDPRGNLALVALGIIARLKPRWFVFENVPGLLSSAEGRDFGLFLRTVDELGYSLAWTVLDAQHFGVAQRRERVFAVGHSGDWRGPAAVLFEPEGCCGNHSPREQARQEIASGLGAGSKRSGGRVGRREAVGNQLIAGTLPACGGTERKHGHGWGQQEWESGYCIAADLRNGALDDVTQTMQSGGKDGERGLSVNSIPHALAFGGNDTRGPIEVATAINAHGGPHGRLDFESETFVASTSGDGYWREGIGPLRGRAQDSHENLVAHALRADGFDASEDGTGRGTPLVAFSCKDHGADASELAPTNAGGQLAVAFSGRKRGDDGRGYDRPPAAMIETIGALDTVKPWNVAAQSAVRRLTPRECERLQGYPDDYTAITFRGKSAADGPRYKALGNSMAVPVMRWILTRIEALENAG